MLESPVQIFSCEIGKVFKNTINRTPPVAGSVVFATKQLNIQCYNNNFGLKAKLSRKNFITLTIIYFCIMSIFLNRSGASHIDLLHVIVSLSKTDCPIYQEENSPVPQKYF